MLEQLYGFLSSGHLSGWQVLLVIAAALIPGYYIGVMVYNVWFHPLASFPGPLMARATRLWYTQSLLRGRIPFDAHRMHVKYGDVIRIAPDELSFIDGEAWKDIYGHRSGKPEMMKDPVFYANLNSGPVSLIRANRDRHGHLRRLLSHGFSDKALREQEQQIQQYANLFMKRVAENSENGTKPVDMVKWYNFFTFDLIGDLAFGEAFGCLESSTYHPWVSMIFDTVKIGSFLRSTQHYPLIKNLVKPLVPKSLVERRRQHRALTEQKALNRIQLKLDRTDFLGRMAEPDSGASRAEFIDTSSTLIIAGSETTATLLSGMTWLLLMNPSKMEKLVKEVRSAFKNEDEINLININSLPYLLACLEESLRVYPPVSGQFPRNVPPGGDKIADYWIPENTIVSVSQWATYHSEKNFRQPDEFIPERWSGDPAYKDDNRSAMQAFSVGPRNCLGKNLAYVEMKLILAKVLWTYDLELVKGGERWIDQEVHLLWDKPPLWVLLKPVVRS